MKDNIQINIKTYQGAEDNEPIALETTGRFGMINGKYYIMYNETELTGFPDTTTTLKVWDKSVVVSRKGKFNMKINYTEGEQFLCLYPTEYGKIGARVKTYSVDFDIDPNALEGKVKVEYTLDINNDRGDANRLIVDIKPIKTSTSEAESSSFEHRGFNTIN